MLILKSKSFHRFASKQRIQDEILRNAIQETELGLYEADLGGGLIKKRIARQGEGKSGGYRTIILYRRGCLAIYLHGFAKSEQDNLPTRDLQILRKAASVLKALSAEEMAKYARDGILVEVKSGREKVCEWRGRHGS
ncbi:MAG: type II toxin-antitoxin system RelE/ParE family toxin [Bryobacterales bacterium]|nr:type II toxin-antitoxin system RelE/ParE family toxin [Bryobacterales bacterium]